MIDDLTTDTLLQVGGRLHPLLLHLPIGLIAGLLFMEVRSLFVKRDPTNTNASAAPALLWLTIGSALLATGSGILLADERMHPASATDLHRNIALIMTGILCVAGLIHATGWRRGYLAMLTLGALAMVPAGHFGATMTHGESFLWAPLLAEEEPGTVEIASDDGKTRYLTHIQPVFDAHCIACHGPDAAKARLRMDSIDALRTGGRAGPAFEPGNPAASLLLTRMRLPLDHDEHMPPASKSQPTAWQIDLVEAWIADGAPESAPFATSEALRVALDAPTSSDTPSHTDSRPEPAPAPPEAIAALLDAQIHVAPIEPGSNRLWVDARPNASVIDDESLRTLLAPVLPSVTELSLASTRVTGDGLAPLATATHLTELDLAWTTIDDAALVHLAACESLEVLRLTGTPVTGAGLDALRALPSLREVYLWRTEITSADLAGRADTIRYILASEPVEAVSVEDPLELTSDRPVPGAPGALSLSPINQTCPVTGAPVDPTYSLVFEGRVIGFCCRHCAATFWEEPDAYRDALPAE